MFWNFNFNYLVRSYQSAFLFVTYPKNNLKNNNKHFLCKACLFLSVPTAHNFYSFLFFHRMLRTIIHAITLFESILLSFKYVHSLNLMSA